MPPAHREWQALVLARGAGDQAPLSPGRHTCLPLAAPHTQEMTSNRALTSRLGHRSAGPFPEKHEPLSGVGSENLFLLSGWGLPCDVDGGGAVGAAGITQGQPKVTTRTV